MRPAQITGLYAGVYLAGCGGEAPAPYTASLNWSLQDYPSDPFYVNPESGFHIYDGEGDLLATVSAGSTGCTVCQASTCATYKVTAFNSSGDSYGALTVEACYTDGGAGKALDGSNAPTDITNLAVTVHPNPATSTVKVCIEDLPGGIPVVVDVVNQLGESVATLYNATPDAELGLCLSLDCSTLPSGNYYADLQTMGMHHAVKFTVAH
jgi:hypothetical protein